MTPRISVRALRRPGRRSSAAFTLVELLVVIAIIGMLGAMLLGGVQYARQAAQRTTCLNNQQQIGKAIIHYATMKEKYPAGYSQQPQSAIAPAFQVVGWVPPILPYLEQNQLYQVYQRNEWAVPVNRKVEMLVCPTRPDPPGAAAPLSYAVNFGAADAFMTNTRGMSGIPTDFPDNGVFFDDFTHRKWNADNGVNSARTSSSDPTYISKRDGTSMTLLFAENLDALEWAPHPMTGSIPPNYPGTIANCWRDGLVWCIQDSISIPGWGTSRRPNPAADGFTPEFLVNAPNRNPNSYSVAMSTDGLVARPSSMHSGGFIATMCDGHSSFISEDIEYRVYFLLMAPNNLGNGGFVKQPSTGVAVIYPNVGQDYLQGGWQLISGAGNPALKPLTEDDLKK